MRRATILFFILSIASSALNYLLYPLLGRILPMEEYVNITVSLSLFTQISTFLSSIIAVTIGISKQGDIQSSQSEVSKLQALILRAFFLLATVFLIFSPLIMKWANTPVIFALPIVMMMLFSIPITVISGYMNGRNLIVQLGFITLLSAGLQFIFSILSSLAFKSGFLTMACMTLSQIIVIILVYNLFRKRSLPNISLDLLSPKNAPFRDNVLLIRYIIGAGVSIMLIGLVQLLDLVTAQKLEGVNIKQYTDLYVLSRVVFFTGMIMVWPFLGAISTKKLEKNIAPLLKLCGFFMATLCITMAVMVVAGEFVTQALFGTAYSISAIASIILMSMSYKVLLLIITACILYFIVIRHRATLWLSLASSASLFIVSHFVTKDSSLNTMLTSFNIAALTFALICIAVYIKVSKHGSKQPSYK